MATRPAIMPLPTMPMSMVFSLICEATKAPITPPAAPRSVTTATSASRPSVADSVEPGLKPNQPKNRMTTPRPTSGIECPGMQQRRERPGGADEVHRRRAREVLPAGRQERRVAVLEPPAAEHPVGAD